MSYECTPPGPGDKDALSEKQLIQGGALELLRVNTKRVPLLMVPKGDGSYGSFCKRATILSLRPLAILLPAKEAFVRPLAEHEAQRASLQDIRML
jgi:hypothetical protein